MLTDGTSPKARTIPGVFERNLAGLLETALPLVPDLGPRIHEIPSPERYLPSTGGRDLDTPSWAAAEHIWNHAAWVFTRVDPRVWSGQHQVTRWLVQCVHDILFPPHLATRRKAVGIEHAYMALLGVNELFYVLREPDSERGRTTLALLPHAESSALRDPRMNRGKRWRGAIMRVLCRQRELVRGGGSYDDSKKVGCMYLEASNMSLYVGYQAEWRKGDRVTAGFTHRGLEHGERVERVGRPGAKAFRYRQWRRGRRGTRGRLGLRRCWRRIAAAMETQAISAIDACGNQKKAKRPGQRGREPKRKRLPPWAGQSARAARRKEDDRRLQRQEETLGPGPRGAPAPPGEPDEGDETDRVWRGQEERGPLDTQMARFSRKRIIRKIRAEEKERQELRDSEGGGPSAPGGGVLSSPEKKRKNKVLRNRMSPVERSRWDMSFQEAYDDLGRRRAEY